MTWVRRLVGVAGFAAALSVVPALAGAALPVSGSTSPADDLSVPSIPAGTAPAVVQSWLSAALGARNAALTTLGDAIATSTDLRTTDRSVLADAVAQASSVIATLTTASAAATTLPLLRKDVAATIHLHVFSVLVPAVNAAIAAAVVVSSADALLAEEPPILAAVAAAKAAHRPTGSDSAQLATFHGDLESALAATSTLPMTLAGIGSLGLHRALAEITSATTAEANATALIASARSSEASIVLSLSAHVGKSRSTGF